MNKPKKQTQSEKNAQAKQELDGRKNRDSVFVGNASIANAAITESFGKDLFPDVDVLAITENLNKSMESVHEGDLKELESMLVGQAKALQVMFATLARRANAQQYLKQYSTYMNLALKTQSQSRATIQAIVELKYPRQVVVTQQANFSAGHQQVNNGAMKRNLDSNTPAPTHAGKNQNEPNKLMESKHENTIEAQTKRLDTRTTGETISSDTPLETVATVHRGKNT